MKRLITGVLVLTILDSCGDEKTNIDPFTSITQEADSIQHKANSIYQEKLPEGPKPMGANKSSDDFIYNSASDNALQCQRVKFPSPYHKGDGKTNIEEYSWKHDNLFTKQHYYTLLFDKEEDMDLVGGTSLTSVRIEWIFVKTQMVKWYYFERVKGARVLEAINLRPVGWNENEDSVEFFNHFAVDSLFRSRRVQEPLAFIASNPDDDPSILETSLDLGQRFVFRPALPADRLSNINYGQRNDDNSPTKTLALKGIGNGFSNILYFGREVGEWQPYKFEDTSIQ